MRNILIVIKHEFRTILQKRSFWIMTFLFPLLIIGFNVGSQILAARVSPEEDLQNLLAEIGGTDAPDPIAYVDEAGLLTAIPPDISPALMVAYPDVATAQAALLAREIEQYFVIAADYLASGEVVVITHDFQPLNVPNDELLNYVIAYNLTDGERETAVTLIDPTRTISSHALAPQNQNDQSSPLTFIVPFATMFIFFFLISMSSGYMLQSVSKEKENRTVEVLLVSLRPRDLMLGKVLGLSLIALIQVVVWLGGGMVALSRGQAMLSGLGSFSLPPGFLIYALLFFALGYILYASLMGAIGALSPNAREAGQYTFIIILPLLLPIWLNFAFIQDPNGTLATAFSLFPLTAPTAMMTRIAAGGVPLWQIGLSLAGLALTTYILVLFSARFFRADTLLSTSSFNWKQLAAEFRRSQDK
ncbi:MAG: ABC transporter permease [Chloroflexi bacterium]|nr:ABC transporter permease [Chloroflexota bacterium]